ncbi:MAG: ABC transporter substrate-binding protein [Actinomycetota bacterium]|nr:ABC transporter substrate-binding protein [Actinomycetota bacterium]
MSWSSKNGLRTFGVVLVLILLVSWLKVDPGSEVDESVAATGDDIEAEEAGELVDDAAGEGEAGDAPTEGAATKGAAPNSPAAKGAVATPGEATQAGPASKAGLECKAGRNGGQTDTGVSGSKIRVASTAVLDGEARSLLADSVTGMKAVVDKVNRAGGICGRLLDLTVVNDSFKDNDGLRVLRNFIEEGYFALPVVPSAEGLGAAILGGWIDRAKIPVVGTDGMRQEQYTSDWVWPVASATVTAMRVMAKYGYEKKGAKKFAIVWDEKYQFGREGKDAFKAQVAAMGGEVVADVALNPDLNSYASEVNEFNGKCKDRNCDMVAMLLLPDTAARWMVRQPERAGLYTAGAQTLFTDDFAQKCVQAAGPLCGDIAVWTGYNPPVGAIASKPGVASYVNDVRAADPRVDVNNQFVEGAYLGMSVFVEALKRVGPELTRARLRQVMDSMTFETDLASTLTWAPKKHTANARSRSFSIVVSQGTFTGWREEAGGFYLDPVHGG